MFGLGTLLLLLVTLAICALPAFVGLSAGLSVLDAGTGAPGAILIGFVAGILTLVDGQVLVALVRSQWLQAAVAAVYAIPAGIAGYVALHGLTGIGFQGGLLRSTFGIVGALGIIATAWVRMSDLFGRHGPTGDTGDGDVVSHSSGAARGNDGRSVVSGPRRPRYR